MLFLRSAFGVQLAVVAAVGLATAAALLVVARRPAGGRARAASTVLALSAASVVVVGTALPTSWPLLTGEGDLVLDVGRGGLGRAAEAVRIGGSELLLLLGNLGMYAVLGAACAVALGLRGLRPSRAAGAAVGACLVLSTAVEGWQYLALGRVAATDDVLLNGSGALLGAGPAAALPVARRP